MNEESVEKEVPTIWEALQAVADEMPIIGKNKKADAGKFSYTYANLEKVYEVAKPIVKKHGFIVTSKVISNKLITTALHTPSNQSQSSEMDITQTDPQKKGGELTYYRRYNYCVLFDIVIADEDKDAQGTGETDKDALKVIKDSLELLNTLDELGEYYKQLKNPKEKKILALFTARKKQLTQ